MSLPVKPQVRVGVGCFVYKDGLFILQQRASSHGEGTWSVPGGHLEFGETPQQCAAREVLEETGVIITNVQLLAVTDDHFEAEGKQYITLWMTSDWVSGEPVIVEPDKCTGLGWFDITTLPSPLFEPCWTNLRAARPELFV